VLKRVLSPPGNPKWGGRLLPGWCKPEFRVTFGSAVEKILEQAREGKGVLIVMGTKASGNMAGHAPLAIAYNVATKAICRVLAFRG
jgi:nucleotide-binding universal stress UspA family protein